jgi:glucose-1-phosphatase
MIKTVFFDIGNVLIYYSNDKLHKNLTALGIDAHDTITRFTDDHNRGLFSSDEAVAMLQQQSSRDVTNEEVRHALCDIFWLNESIIPVLAMIKEKGIRLVTLSNISEIHHRYIDATYDIFKWFDDFVMSYQVKAIKPEAAIYQEALSKAHCLPEECFYTDDVMEFITAARSHGIAAEQYIDTPLLLEKLAIE